MPSPLAISIALHYHCCTTDFRDGDFSALIMPGLLAEFVAADLLIVNQPGSTRRYGATAGLTKWVEALCDVPWPERQWVIPK